MEKYFTRMGDGSGVYMTAEEIRADIVAGMEDAVNRGKVAPLTQEEMDRIFEITTMDGNIVGVKRGMEIVTTSDSGADKIGAKCVIDVERSAQAVLHERVLGCDSVDIGFRDYNYKTVKGIVDHEVNVIRAANAKVAMPIFYGAMPNLGFYTKPDGPVDNWAVLLPAGKVAEAWAAQEEAIEHSVRDIVYVAEQVYLAGADAINLDTSGAAGDADFLAALKATEIITERFPGLAVEMGMAGEFVLGMHGKLSYDGVRLAGLYPHKQVALAEKAGASIFGAVVNTNCNMTFPWNMGRVCTFIKACTEVANIPVHANVGMGVCGTPMCEILPQDSVSRAGKCLVEICKVDGF